MRRLAVIVLAGALAAPAGAMAQKEPAPAVPIEYVDMGDFLINGQRRGPLMKRLSARQRVEFERIVKLKRDVLPQLVATGRAPALR